MSIVSIYILASTVALAFIAAIWSNNGVANILMKLALVGLAVVGAICSASVLGIAA